MKDITKTDYMIGPFVCYLNSKGILAEIKQAVGRSKIIEFISKNKRYICYFKYAASASGSNDKTWSFSYTKNDIILIKQVLTNMKNTDNFWAVNLCKASDTDTEIAILNLNELKRALGIRIFGEKNKISYKISRKSSSNYLHCLGSQGQDVRILQDLNEIFDNL